MYKLVTFFHESIYTCICHNLSQRNSMENPVYYSKVTQLHRNTYNDKKNVVLMQRKICIYSSVILLCYSAIILIYFGNVYVSKWQKSVKTKDTQFKVNVANLKVSENVFVGIILAATYVHSSVLKLVYVVQNMKNLNIRM